MSSSNPKVSRFRHAIEVEDALLVLWFLVIETLVVRDSDSSPLTWVEPGDGSWPPMLWLTGLAALFVLFTRGSRDTTIDQAVKRRILMALPFYWLLSLLGMIVSSIRGGEKSARHLGGDEAEWPMPKVPDWLRRLVATPIQILGDAAFLDAFESQRSAQLGMGEAPILSDQISALFVFALPYLLFVVGPRVAAGASGSWHVWLLRFAFYAIALLGAQELGLGAWL